MAAEFTIPEAYQSRLEFVETLNTGFQGDECFLLRPPGDELQVAIVSAGSCMFALPDGAPKYYLYVDAIARTLEDYRRERDEIEIVPLSSAQVSVGDVERQYPPRDTSERSILNDRMCEVALAALALRTLLDT